jgi:hypothetical protein
MSTNERVEPLPLMPTRRQIWTRFLLLGVVVGTGFSALFSTALLMPSLEMSYEAIPLFLVTFFGPFVSLFFAAQADHQRRSLLRGLADRETLVHLAQHPERLICGSISSSVWNSAQTQILHAEEEVRKQRRVQECLDAVPSNVKDLRGESLREVLKKLRVLLKSFPDSQTATTMIQEDAWFFLYEGLVHVLLYRISESIGLRVQCHTDTPGDGVAVEFRGKVGECRESSQLRDTLEKKYHASWYGYYVVERPRCASDLYTNLSAVITDHEDLRYKR